jgi:hypothetical protein
MMRAVVALLTGAWVVATWVIYSGAEANEVALERLVPFTTQECWDLCTGAREIHHISGYAYDPANDSMGECSQLYKPTVSGWECVPFRTACECIDEGGACGN